MQITHTWLLCKSHTHGFIYIDFEMIASLFLTLGACRNCCNDDGRKLDEGTTKYPKAILEVCG